MIEVTAGHTSSLGDRPQLVSDDYYANDYSERISYDELMLKVEFDLNFNYLKASKYWG